MVVPQKIKKDYQMIQQLHFRVYTQKNWKWELEKYINIHVHSNIIHTSQKVEATQMPIPAQSSLEGYTWLVTRSFSLPSVSSILLFHFIDASLSHPKGSGHRNL